MKKMMHLDLTKKMGFPCISEENYEEEMEKTVEPYLDRFIETGYFDGLYYELFLRERSKGTVVISHGYTESCVKYHELIYYFHRQGYQVAMMEHRGHGKSAREVEKKCLVHIDSFSQYVKDLQRRF